MNKPKITQNIKDFTEKNGWTAYRLSKVSGCSHWNCKKYVNDPTRIPDAPQLAKLCVTFGVTPGDLLNLEAQ